ARRQRGRDPSPRLPHARQYTTATTSAIGLVAKVPAHVAADASLRAVGAGGVLGRCARSAVLVGADGGITRCRLLRRGHLPRQLPVLQESRDGLQRRACDLRSAVRPGRIFGGVASQGQARVGPCEWTWSWLGDGRVRGPT